MSSLQFPVPPPPQEVDPEILRKIVEEFSSIAESRTYPDALDQVVDYCVIGMDKFGLGDTRVSEICEECYEPLNKGFTAFNLEALKREAEQGSGGEPKTRGL